MAEKARSALERWVREGYPLESCGVLVGRQDGTRVEVERAIQARNLNRKRAHDRYELDPKDFLLADEKARDDGLEIVGIWHSHPDHPARPSETDRVAAWAGWSYVIISVTRDGVADMRSWRLNSDQFVEESIELCPR
ncbi:MAG: Mov34/MPN/PAD-1 family protein [Acidiferrobacterales bacterium]